MQWTITVFAIIALFHCSIIQYPDAFMEDGRPLANRLFARLPFVRTSVEETRPISQAQKSPPTSPTARRRRKDSLRKVLLSSGHNVASSRKAGEYLRPRTTTPASAKGEDDVLDDEQTLANHYGSSTDEDEHVDGHGDAITLQPRSTSGTLQAKSLSTQASPPIGSRPRRKSLRSTVPALTAPPISLTGTTIASIDELVPIVIQHDYSETEWWGWIILLATWIVFVVGMGSCLGIWSWAWDVGETPYAPPELEDDPTLPIVGYYPALIIMTGVMAWVWVMIAWVGMKYFRHAKVWDGEEY